MSKIPVPPKTQPKVVVSTTKQENIKWNDIYNQKFKLNKTETKESKVDEIFGIKQTLEKKDPEWQEYFDKDEDIFESAKITAKMIKESKHMVAYTGAGISTSSGIGDYRGPTGVWTLRDQGKSSEGGISMKEAKPTYSHYALTELIKKGYLKHIISTNVDGLHLRSGTSIENINELHGNTYKKKCTNPKCENIVYNGVNGSKESIVSCPKCSSKVSSTIVNFGDSIPEIDIKICKEHTSKQDLALVLGTSLQVSPSNMFPFQSFKNGGKIVIVNLQKTPLDKYSLKVYAKCDQFMKLVMQELGLDKFDLEYDWNKKK